LSNIAVNSNVATAAGCSPVRPVANLIDGDENSFAYPCNLSVDYTVDPGQSAFVDAVRVVWGYFGGPNYAQSWRLLGLALDGRSWEVIARGGQPGSTESVIPVHNRYRKVRIAADGVNWLGIYEIQLFGSLFPNTGQYTVKSNVIEDPVYSIAAGYQASNLLDGDPTTLAYPGAVHLDYQIALGQPTQLSSAFISWGVYGSNALYVNSWSLLARNGASQPWTAIAQGGFPHSATTLLNLDFVASDVRIVADGPNWIGIYDLKIKGTSLQ